MPEKPPARSAELINRFTSMPDIKIQHKCLNYQAIHTAYALYTLDPSRRGRCMNGAGDGFSLEIRMLLQSTHGILPKVGARVNVPTISLGALSYFCYVTRIHILQTVNGSTLKVRHGTSTQWYSVSLSELVGRWD